MNRYLEKVSSMLAGAALGAGLGGIAGGMASNKVPKKERRENIYTGAAIGGIAGASLGSMYKSLKTLNEFRTDGTSNEYKKHFRDHKSWDDFFKQQQQHSGGSRGRSYYNGGGSDLGSIHSDLKAPPGGFKTKAEATKHYRQMARKHHPDRGGKTEDMQKINSAWGKFKKHPDGFEKLAGLNNLYLDWLYDKTL